MLLRLLFLALFALNLCLGTDSIARAAEPDSFPVDVIPTSAGELGITFIGHGTLMLRFGGRVMHIDPYSSLADYATLPKADLVLLTHHHPDHLDPKALAPIRTDATVIIGTASCAGALPGIIVLTNGDTHAADGFTVEAVPAYNLIHTRENGQPFHPKGEGNGYILTFGSTRVYVAGDTENTPEMKALGNIEVAFLPMNLPYTMTPEMVADAVRAFKPKVLYPYHYGDTDTSRLTALLAGLDGTEIRIRPMK